MCRYITLFAIGRPRLPYLSLKGEEVCIECVPVSHQVCLSCLLYVMCGDDDGGPTSGDQLYKVLPDPK